jgi:hypothetical protein
VARENLDSAKRTKNDEFYTQFSDVQREIGEYLDFDPHFFKGKTVLLPCDDPEWSNFTKYFAQNFEAFGLKKLISTSYAPNKKPKKFSFQPTLFELENPGFEPEKSVARGKIFTLTRDISNDQKIDIDDLEWSYLGEDGDFRSDEVTKLRDEADIVITNPPFSLFREFLAWLTEGGKFFSILSNKNCLTYKEVFPLIQSNRVWPGSTPMGTEMVFDVPPEAAKELLESGRNRTWSMVDGRVVGRSSSLWLTNIEHGRRHDLLKLMTEAANIKYSKFDEIRGIGYQSYSNCDAIEVPRVDGIPSDFRGVMGVPISFLGKYNPDQFEIVRFRHGDDGQDLRLEDGKTPYFRVLIRHKSPEVSK